MSTNDVLFYLVNTHLYKNMEHLREVVHDTRRSGVGGGGGHVDKWRKDIPLREKGKDLKVGVCPSCLRKE